VLRGKAPHCEIAKSGVSKILTRAKSPSDSDIVELNDLLVMPAFVDTLRAAGLDSLEGLFSLKQAELLTKPGLQSWRERLRFDLDHQGRHCVFFMKRFTNPQAAGRKEVRQAGNGANSVAGIEWNWMRQLAANSIPCTRPVAFGEAIRRWREVRSAVVMEAVPGESLETWVRRLPLTPAKGRREGDRDRAGLRAVLDESAQLVARLHSAGYAHRDLYLSHLFHDPTAAPGERLRLIDLQRVFRPAFWKSRWLVKDLAALNYSTPSHVASRADRLRWLTRYLTLSAPPNEEAPGAAGSNANRATAVVRKRLALQVFGKTQQIAKHDERRARSSVDG
jgi:hypothetical protein